MAATAAQTPAVSGSAAATGPSSASSQTHSAAAAQASEQPRNRNAEPSPSANSDRDPANGPPPAADRLHRHALESIFAFLGLRDSASALRVARSWLSAVRSMRSLQLQMRQPSAPLAVVARSAMGRHVGAFDPLHLNAAVCAVLADRMAHLRTLRCYLALPPPAGLAFPAALRRLDIDVSGPADADRINGAIAAIGRLAQLESLALLLSLNPQISFVPLAALEHLRALDIRDQNGQIVLSDVQVDELRALRWLQEVKVQVTPALLRRLIRRPHDLQWKLIPLPHPLDDDTAAHLPQLPSLTQIGTDVVCERFEWLCGLPNLTQVRLDWNHSEEGADGRMESLVAGLQSCSNIEILSLEFCNDLTAAHLADLLPRLPRLRELVLYSLGIDSLSFLSQPPMTEQLSSMTLVFCQRLPLADLRHVHALRGLTKLVLSCSFTAPLGDRAQTLLTPPSAALPLLKEFRYRRP